MCEWASPRFLAGPRNDSVKGAGWDEGRLDGLAVRVPPHARPFPSTPLRVNFGLRVSGSAAPGDGFTPRRIFDRFSGAGMTEGRGRIERRDSFAQRGFAPTVYQLLERYALEGEAGLAKRPADDRHAPTVSATLIGMLGLRAVNGRSDE